MKRKDECRVLDSRVERSSTRDAVETAIDMAKRDKTTTWESSLKNTKRISRWQAASADEPRDKEHPQR